jgi:DNA-binding NarL/FixJ family response regulator
MEYPENRIKLMIVDDHSLLRQGFISLFKQYTEFEIIADAPNGQKAINILHKVKPDILLLDVEMPIMNGKETLEYVTKYHPEIKVVMLTMYAEYFYEREFESLGACSVIDKNTEPDNFLNILREVSKGRYKYDLVRGGKKPEKNDRHLQIALSHREIKIVQFICNNLTNEDISRHLNISVNTVRYHRKVISSKTLTYTVADLVKYAIRNGLISTD